MWICSVAHTRVTFFYPLGEHVVDEGGWLGWRLRLNARYRTDSRSHSRYLCLGGHMKKILVVGALMLSLTLFGCVTRVHWGAPGRSWQAQHSVWWAPHHNQRKSGR